LGPVPVLHHGSDIRWQFVHRKLPSRSEATP
jgi:hypothetical protein